MSNNSNGKLIFSNPPQSDSAFKADMKDVSAVSAFAVHAIPQKSAKTVKSFAMPKVAVFSKPIDVTVTAQNPLIISGTGPVEANFGTVTIEPGGQIIVSTAANINIATLKKL